jgi:hypothetical protein
MTLTVGTVVDHEMSRRPPTTRRQQLWFNLTCNINAPPLLIVFWRRRRYASWFPLFAIAIDDVDRADDGCGCACGCGGVIAAAAGDVPLKISKFTLVSQIWKFL